MGSVSGVNCRSILVTGCWRALCTGNTTTTGVAEIPERQEGQGVAGVLEDRGRNMRWDPCSGQFSFSQGSQLRGVTHVVKDLAKTTPDSIAVIWRQDKPPNEQLVSYSQLELMIDHVVGILNTEDKTVVNEEQGTLIYLPVSILAVAVILARASLQRKHTLVF